MVYIDYRSIDARKNKSYSLVLQYSWRIFFETPLCLSGSHQRHSDIKNVRVFLINLSGTICWVFFFKSGKSHEVSDHIGRVLAFLAPMSRLRHIKMVLSGPTYSFSMKLDREV